MFYVSLLECVSDSIVNGGFESGTSAGWAIGGGTRVSVLSSAIRPETFLPNGSPSNPSTTGNYTRIVTRGNDSLLKSLMNETVFEGIYALQVGDQSPNYRVSVLSQIIRDYRCPDIYFAWLAVQQHGHLEDDGPAIVIELEDMTAGGPPTRHSYHGHLNITNFDTRFRSNGIYVYTPSWQTQHFPIESNRSGHNFRLSILALDCTGGGHQAYVYVDSFGSVRPKI